jgi:hypothetical protein
MPATLAPEVARVITYLGTIPAVVVFDGRLFYVLKGGKNISGGLSIEEVGRFVADQVESACSMAETTGVWDPTTGTVLC